VGLRLLFLRIEPASFEVWRPAPEPLRWWRLGPILAGLVCSVVVGRIALQRPETESFCDVFLLWVLGIVLVMAAFFDFGWLRDRRGELASTIRGHMPEIFGVAMVVLAAAVFRFADLEHIPGNLGGDEGTWGAEGLALLEGRFGNPFATGWFGFQNMSFIPWGLSAKIFGNSVAALRLPSALIGTAAVLAVYLLGRELWGRRTAAVGAVLLAFGHFHIHYSRLAVNNIFDTLVAASAFWLLVLGLRTRRTGPMVAAGVILGLGWYGYLGARLAGIIAVVYVGWRALVERGFLRVHWRRILVVGVSALVVIVPLLMLYIDEPELLTSRTNQVGIFSSGWLERELEITGDGTAKILAEQARESVLGFHYTLDRVFWYFPGVPLLDFVGAVLLVIGLGWAVAGWRDHRHMLLLLWFWLAVFFGWFLTENPPSSMRLIIAAPAIALLAAAGLRGLLRIAGSLSSGGDRRWTVATVVVVAVVAALNLHFYFRVYTPKRIYGNPSAEVATVLARYLVEVGDDLPLYFMGSPWIYWDFGTNRYLVPDVDGIDLSPDEDGELPQVDVSRGARFVVLKHRSADLKTLRARYPDARETSIVSDADGRVMYWLYEVAPPRG
jgi:4-amino-4-deoxy-L-arabinose transferase-like glycosyltransferase